VGDWIQKVEKINVFIISEVTIKTQ